MLYKVSVNEKENVTLKKEKRKKGGHVEEDKKEVSD